MTEAGQRPRPVLLCVLDGFGLNDDPRRNALLAARMPAWDRLTAGWPTCRLEASGEAVGLPAGQMGNSEVGHLNLGAGFPVLQDLPRITRAIEDGSFFANPVLREAAGRALERGTRLHLMGLVGPGGVHALDGHIEAMVELAARAGLPPQRVLLH
ncbi:MAG TPA: 2,3-bisphosphoglycerate-independent phosphoglycerate mutase, partial [Candidatus Dormibacteraeota bacterium]|nr:2,3-bisphosphoglycerate-independent phosphoglycerate mutase [Candidatus Dormibacteraeota bacterium]